jgi:hypothetical protein
VRILYVHIARTGGTSLNRFAASQLRKGQYVAHLEHVPEAQRSEHVRRRSYVSGHVRYEVLKEQLDVGAFVKVVTFRRPIDQIISHLAWVRRLSEAAQARQYANAMPHTQELSRDLSHADLSDPTQLSRLVAGLDDRQLRLLDNTQTRYVCRKRVGRRVVEGDLQTAFTNLDEFELVGITEQFGELLRSVCELMGWKPPRAAPRENVSACKYGLDPERPELRAALQPLVTYDEALYERACQRCARRRTAGGAGAR